MLNATVLDVAIGLIFVFLMLSVACSMLNERLQSWLDKRATMLGGALDKLLGKAMAVKVKDHPLIQAMSHDAELPSYIPSGTFAVALLESLVKTSADQGMTFASLQKAVGAIPDERARKSLNALLIASRGDLGKVRAHVEHWFDSAMTRLSGAYKRHVTRVLLVMGFVLAAATNADAIELVQRLEHESSLRTAVAAQAQAQVKPAEAADAAPDATPDKDTAKLNITEAQLSRLDLLFWDLSTSVPDAGDAAAAAGGDAKAKAEARAKAEAVAAAHPRAVHSYGQGWWWWAALKLAGFFMTALAVSLGAPFWFDLLGRLVNLRETGDKPAKSEASEVDNETKVTEITKTTETTATETKATDTGAMATTTSTTGTSATSATTTTPVPAPADGGGSDGTTK
jgi:hypothetical protein